jgi:two-component system, NarL family, nitrate/nitrite response regulator NarL
MTMRVLIADDHPLYREAVRAQIERLFASAEIEEVASLGEVVERAEGDRQPFDLFLIDYRMPGMSLAALGSLAKAFPKVPIAVISGTAEAADVRATIHAGARGFIPKTATGKHLAHAIQLLLAGGTSIPAHVMLTPGTETPSTEGPPWLALLTGREVDVLKGVMRGLSNKEIGRELGIAEVTVKLHLRSVFRKMGARSRADAAVIATKAGVA